MNVRAIPLHTRGFDCNFPLTQAQARQMAVLKYRYAIRYVPRVKQAPYDLTAKEVELLHLGGLAVMPVQHVENPNWIPHPVKGAAYGRQAAMSATDCGILPGTSVWLDLEGVKFKTPSEEIIGYCNRWYDSVATAGFLPGIYVGDRALLSPNQLYRRLKFTRYWSAYNLNLDEYPATVGVCMKQGVAHSGDYPPDWDRLKYQIDTDTVTGDAKGRYPMVTAPDEWDV